MPSFSSSEQTDVLSVFNQYNAGRAGFFSPYQSGADFGLTLATPVVYPVLSLVSLSAAGILSVIAVGSIAAAAIAEIKGDRDLGSDSLTYGALASGFAGGCVMASAVLALATLSEFVKIFTRAIASVVAPLINLCSTTSVSDEFNEYQSSRLSC